MQPITVTSYPSISISSAPSKGCMKTPSTASAMHVIPTKRIGMRCFVGMGFQWTLIPLRSFCFYSPWASSIMASNSSFNDSQDSVVC